jgi:hypothetical protein
MATASPLLVLDALGQPRIEPSVSSIWEFDITSATRFVAQHDVILIGAFEGGTPNVMLPFLDLRSLQSTVDPEALHILGADLADYLKRPSFDDNVRGAYRIYIMRIGHPTQATLTLQDAGAQGVLRLTSTDYGSYTNKLSVEVASGSVVGKRVTVRFRDEQTILDNLQNVLHLAYVGNATAATLTITRAGDRATRLQTTLTGATDGSINLDLDLTQDALATLQQLEPVLNGQNGYRALLDHFGAPGLPTAELDAVAGTSIRTPVTMSLHYVGTGTTATLTTTATTLTTTVGGTPADSQNIDLTAAGTNTLGELVAYLDSLAAYTCALGPNADPEALTAGLFALVAGQDIRTVTYNLLPLPGKMDYLLTAGLGSIIYALTARVPRLHALRVTGATNVPANVAQTFLAGGTNPAPTTNDWLTGLDVVEQEALAGGLVFPISTAPIVQDATLAWVLEQRSTHGAAFRTFLAAPANLSPAQAQQLALGFNSTYAAMLAQGTIAPGGVVEQPPLYASAMYCGAAAGALPTQPVTRLVLRAQALPSWAKVSKAVREDMLVNGLAALEEAKGIGVRLTLAVTTSRSSDRIDRILSESMARDVIDQRIRAYVEPLIPHWAMMNFMPTVKGVVVNALKSLEADGLITQGRSAQGRILPAWLPVQVHIQGGLLCINVQVFIGGEIDHIQIFGTIAYQVFNLEIPVGA